MTSPVKVTRRDFLKLGAAGVVSAVLAGCQSPRRWVALEPYVRPPEEQLAGQPTFYASTCRQCPAGCGIVVRVMNGRALKIEGNPEHPLNHGKLCARGQAGLQLLYNPDRLPGPVQQAQRGSRRFEALTWNEALNTLYAKIVAAKDAVGVWVDSTTSGHLFDLLGRFALAIGGVPPLAFDLYAELNGYQALADATGPLFGPVGLPAYDLGHADIVLSFGADLVATGLSAVRYGIEFGSFRGQALGKRGYLVALEPRMSTTAAVADQWLPIRPGSEALVAQALAVIIAEEGLGSSDRVAAAGRLFGPVDVGSVAAASDLSVEQLRSLAEVFATAERPLAIPGGVLGGQSDGVELTTAVQALNLIAGVAGRPGGLLSSGSPSLNTLSAASFAQVQTFIQAMRSGRIKVLLIHGANPAYDLPDNAGFRDALAQVPFVVSFAPILDETAVQADLILPDRTYLESWGYEVVSPTFGVPVVGSQQPVVTPVFDARSTADVLLTIAKGFDRAASELPWADEVAFLKEMITQLPPGDNDGEGPDVIWARFLQHGGWWSTELAGGVAGGPRPQPPTALQVQAPQFQGSEQEYPYFLHLYPSDLLSDGRGASQPWLQGSPDPMTTVAWQSWVEVHPDTAKKLGMKDGDVARITSTEGEIEAPVYVYPAIRPDTVAIPVGQGHTDLGRYARERGSNPLQLVGAAVAAGSSLAWAAVRVKLAPTGRRVALARFENATGVTEGFVNQAFPGG